MATILVPAPYRGPTQGRDRIESTGATIGACFDQLEAQYPGLRDLIVDARSGGVHRFVKLVLNGKLLGREAAVLATPVAEVDEIEVLAAIGGG
jgi:molybdopterin converting factor small subunit